MNPTMLSRVVWRLEDAGLVGRRPDPRDRRAALLDATAAGRQLHERIRAERTDALSQPGDVFLADVRGRGVE